VVRGSSSRAEDGPREEALVVSDAFAPHGGPAGPPRPVRQADAAELIRLVGAAFREHPGCVLDLEGLDADLRAPATSAAAAGARWWVVDGDRTGMAATVGAGAPSDGVVELKRLYVAAAARRRGLGERLVRWVEEHAAGLGADRLELWSDTRFEDAHRLYERLGWTDTGRRRDLHDPSDTTERHFVRDVVPLEPSRRAAWEGPHGLDRCCWFPLPDGRRLAGSIGDDLVYELEVDARWRPRRVDVTAAGRRRRLTGDGRGHWWVDGHRRHELDGCVTADVAFTPAAQTLWMRGGGTGPARVASVQGPRLDVVPEAREGRRLDAHRWCDDADPAEGAGTGLVVDDDGLVVTYRTWRRRS
jgi:GNAT superfamily N-acetyltransferase